MVVCRLVAGRLLGLVILAAVADVAEAAPSGFYRVEQREGVWWFVDPAGQPFLSKGVDTVRFAQDRIRGTETAPYADACRKKYGSEEKWRDAIARRLFSWGFNSLGAWADDELAKIDVSGRRLARSPILNLGSRFVAEQSAGAHAWLHGVFPDVFDPRFEPSVQRTAREICAPQKDDATILGWFTDNELRWGPDWRGTDELLTLFLNMPVKASGREAAIEFLKKRYATIADFNAIWGGRYASWQALASSAEPLQPPYVLPPLWEQNQEVERQANDKDARRKAFTADCETFAGLLAERYFAVSVAAIRAVDPGHLVFGARFAYVPQKAVIEAAGRHLDVISFNCYAFDPTHALVAYAPTGRPLLVGELSFRGDDVGLPNTKGAGPRVPTQADRARAFEAYVTTLLRHPQLVGYHWFEHADEPKEGRFDGENSNYGIVDINDQVYEVLAQAMQKVNAEAERLHAGSR